MTLAHHQMGASALSAYQMIGTQRLAHRPAAKFSIPLKQAELRAAPVGARRFMLQPCGYERNRAAVLGHSSGRDEMRAIARLGDRQRRAAFAHDLDMIHHAEFLRREGDLQRDAAPCDVVLFHVSCLPHARSRRLRGDSFLGSGLFDLDLRLKTMQKICGALRMGGGGKDRALVVPQDL